MSRKATSDIPAIKSKPPQRLVVMNINKGLNNLVSPSLIDNREWSDLQNVEYDEGGVIRKRSGYVTFGPALTAAKGLAYYVTESFNQVCTVDSGTLKFYNGSSWTSATGATMTSGKETYFSNARLKLFIWNGFDGGAYFDGAAVTRPGTMPKAKFALYFQSKHIASGVDGQPSRLYISNISDATDFTVTTGGTQPQPDNTNDSENSNPNVPGATVFAGTPALTEANVIDVRKNDGDKITGLVVFQNSVLVFKERAIYQLTFDSSGNPTIIPVTYATGCVSHRSIVSVENDVYFMSREGVRTIGNEANFYTAIRTNVLSIRVNPTLSTINPTYYARMNAFYFDNKYIMGVPTSTSSIDRAVVYDRRFQAFTVWKNFNAQAMVRYVDANNKQYLLFLDDGGTQVYQRQDGTYADNGVAIEAWVTSKAQDLGNPDLTKFWIDIGIIWRSLTGTMTITVYSDDNTVVGITTIANTFIRGLARKKFGVFKLGSDGETATATTSFSDTPERLRTNTNSRTLKYKVYNNNINENFVILGNVFAYYPKSHFYFDSSKVVYF